MPGCISCRIHTGGTPVVPQVYASVDGWCIPEVQKSKEPCVEICSLLRQYADECSLGYIHVATPTRRLTPRQRSIDLSTWNAPLAKCLTRRVQSRIFEDTPSRTGKNFLSPFLDDPLKSRPALLQAVPLQFFWELISRPCSKTFYHQILVLVP